MTSYGSTDEERMSDAQPSMKDLSPSYHDSDFELGQTYYLSSTTDKKKCLSAFLPIIIFIALMGGAVWALNKDFNHLYPGHGVSGSNDYDGSIVVHSESSSTTNTAMRPIPTTDQSSSKENVVYSSSDSSACSNHPKCHHLGLTGHCCPTVAEIFLDCC